MKKIKLIFCFLFIVLSFYCFYNYLLNNNSIINEIIYDNNDIISIKRNNKLLEKLSSSVTKVDGKDIITLLNYDGNKYNSRQDNSSSSMNNNLMKKPLVYIYNTHDEEEYSNKGFEAYNVDINVKLASYMLQDELNNKNIISIVEERPIIKEVKKRNLEYRFSYDISREYFIDMKSKYPSLLYFIDVHRDGIAKNLSTVNINNKNYAKLMFFIGEKHKTSNLNLETINKLKSYLDDKYPGLTRNTYKVKEYTYNQDLSPNSFLIEVGGQYNTFFEVYNSMSALSEALSNSIGSNNE